MTPLGVFWCVLGVLYAYVGLLFWLRRTTRGGGKFRNEAH